MSFMRALLACILLAACAGPTQRTAETPTARTRRPPSLAPPASGEDKERYQLNQQFEDMRDASQANRELEHASAPPPTSPASPAPPAAKPVKRGPAEQAHLPPVAPPK